MMGVMPELDVAGDACHDDWEPFDCLSVDRPLHDRNAWRLGRRFAILYSAIPGKPPLDQRHRIWVGAAFVWA